jgi:hypothetical protein
MQFLQNLQNLFKNLKNDILDLNSKKSQKFIKKLHFKITFQ